jgi:hypothetical protein
VEADQFSVQEMKKYRKMARASPSRMLTSRRKSEPHFYVISNFGSGMWYSVGLVPKFPRARFRGKPEIF